MRSFASPQMKISTCRLAVVWCATVAILHVTSAVSGRARTCFATSGPASADPAASGVFAWGGSSGRAAADDGYVASALIVNPFDWHTIRTERAESGDGQYVAGRDARRLHQRDVPHGAEGSPISRASCFSSVSD